MNPSLRGPEPLDMLRALPRIRSDALGFLRESADRYGDLVEFPIPGQKMFFANHPDAVKQLLQTEHRTHDRQTVRPFPVPSPSSVANIPSVTTSRCCLSALADHLADRGGSPHPLSRFVVLF